MYGLSRWRRVAFASHFWMGPSEKGTWLSQGGSGKGLFRRWFLMCGSTVRIGSAYKELEEQAAEFRFAMLKSETSW